MDLYVVVCFFAGLLSLSGWIVGEWRGDAVLRRGCGMATMVLTAVVASYVGWLGPQYSITRYEWSLHRISEMLEAGQAERVIREIQSYESDHAPSNPNPVALLRELSRD